MNRFMVPNSVSYTHTYMYIRNDTSGIVLMYNLTLRWELLLLKDDVAFLNDVLKTLEQLGVTGRGDLCTLATKVFL